MKKIYASFLTLFVSLLGFSQYTVNFDGTGETKGAYGSGSVTLSELQWNMTEALIGADANDWKNGIRSARMRGYAASSISMLEDKTDGLGTLSFNYQRYGTDAQVPWKVEYSTDSGVTWLQIGSSFTALAESTVQVFSEEVNVEGNVRVRILADISSGTSNRRLNIDDIVLTDFPASGPSSLITVSTNSIDDLDYLLGNGPSASNSFTVSISDLEQIAGNLQVVASENFEVSTDNIIFSDDLNLTYADNILAFNQVFVRLKNNLEGGLYSGTVTVSGGEALDKVVNVEGTVTAPFSIPFENDFRTQANYDAAVATGFTFDGAVVFGGTAGGGYTRMPNLSSIISPSINFTGQNFIEVSFALTTFGGNTGQKLALKYSTNDGLDYQTIGTFDVTSSYTTFTQLINVNGFEGVGKLKFEMVEGSNQIRFRDLSIEVVEEILPAINPAFCGSTINSAIYDVINLDGNYDGDMYEFTITAGEQVSVLEKELPNIRLGEFGSANFNYGTTYNLSVRVKYGDTYTNASPACEVTLTSNPTTSVELLCGQTAGSIHSKVYVFSVSQASSYRYSVTNLTTNQEQFYISSNRYFTFASLESFDFATVYEVKAQVKIGNAAEYGDFGAVCNVTSPESVVSKLREAFCGYTLPTLNANIYASFVVGADGYKFRITENGNSQEIERPDSRFSFAFASNILLSQDYEVEVAVRYNGVYGPYSDVCIVTTPTNLPTTSLRPQFCGATLNSLGSNFYARFIVGASSYRFKTTINGEEVVVERPDSRCFMSAFPGAMMNQTYQIQVAANINGIWSEYGNICSVTYGVVNASKVVQESNKVEITAYPNPSSTSFVLQFDQTIEQGDLSVYDVSGKLIQNFNFSEVQTLEFGNNFNTGIYIVKVTTNNFSKTLRLIKN